MKFKEVCQPENCLILMTDSTQKPKRLFDSWSSSSYLWKAAPSKSNLSNAVTRDPVTDCEGRTRLPAPGEPLTATPTSLPQQYLMLSKIRLTCNRQVHSVKNLYMVITNLRAYLTLEVLDRSKELALVVLTSMCGYAMAPAPFQLSAIFICSIGTGLLSCAANAINQYHEVPFDAQMARTRNRLLVRNIVTSLHAAGFAATCATTGGLVLYFGANGLTAALGFTNLVLYTSIYTPLKRISILNTWVGSVVGALPPLMGWACAVDSLGAGAWVLAGILYAWQFPHFNALSWNLRPDYSRAGYRMMAVTDPGLCRRTTLRYTIAILCLSCAAPFTDLTNFWFVLESLPLNGYFTYLAWKFYQESDSSSSRKLFRFSLVHLPLLMLLMLINKKSPWFKKKEDIQGISSAL